MSLRLTPSTDCEAAVGVILFGFMLSNLVFLVGFLLGTVQLPNFLNYPWVALVVFAVNMLAIGSLRQDYWRFREYDLCADELD